MGWNVTAENDDGGFKPLPFISKTGEYVSAERVHRLVMEHYGSQLPSAFRFLEHEHNARPIANRRIKTGIESIFYWAREIRDLVVSTSTTGQVRIDFDEGALVMTRRRNPTRAQLDAFNDAPWRPNLNKPGFVDEFIAAVWNEPELVIIPVNDIQENRSIEISYSPTDTTGRQARHYVSEFDDDEGETLFEWRGYFGAKSGAIDGLVRMAKAGSRYVAHIAGVEAGFIVGTIMRRTSTSKVSISSDVLFKSILRTNSESHPQFAQQVLPLDPTVGSFEGESAIVLVHGTVSSCAAAFRDLPKQSRMLAFEHDTFLSILANAKDLERRIRAMLPDIKRLLLIGHSRGGLVARCAAHRLVETGRFNGSLDVWTYGTPHKGTPIATAGAEALRLIATVSNLVNGVSGCLDSEMAAIIEFLPLLEKAPPGIAQMIPDCDFLEMLSPPGNNENNVIAHAGNYDINGPKEGFGIAFRGSFGRTAFDGKANDLVVPTASAAGCGSAPRYLSDCAHSSYFAQQTIQMAINSW